MILEKSKVIFDDLLSTKVDRNYSVHSNWGKYFHGTWKWLDDIQHFMFNIPLKKIMGNIDCSQKNVIRMEMCLVWGIINVFKNLFST